MRKTQVQVQKWVDNLPPSPKVMQSNNSVYSSLSPSRAHLRMIGRDLSLQSDDCSHCSSVESVLESRRADPEAVLIGLGFGPPNGNNFVPRIPQRFRQPSKLLTNIDINQFLEEQGELAAEPAAFNTNPSSPARNKPKTTKDI